jgi:hypothetical protein
MTFNDLFAVDVDIFSNEKLTDSRFYRRLHATPSLIRTRPCRFFVDAVKMQNFFPRKKQKQVLIGPNDACQPR